MVFVLVVNLIWLHVGDMTVQAKGNVEYVIPEPIPLQEVTPESNEEQEESYGQTIDSLKLYAGVTVYLMPQEDTIISEDYEEEVITIVEETEEVQVPEEPEEPEYRMRIDDKTLEVLTRVVEAEVTGSTYTYNGEKLTYDELLQSKIRVAQVFMNRVEDNDSFDFIDDLYESLTYKGASSTFGDGRYYKVTITDITREAVELALLADTPDYTQGALYFSSGTTTCKYGDWIFTDDVGHSFFK